MELEIITVDNGTNKMKYSGTFAKKEQEIIKDNIDGLTLNLFSGISDIGNIRVDFKFGNVKNDVFEYLDTFIKKMNNFNSFFDCIIIDAPYNEKFANKYKKFGNTPEQFIIFADTERTTKLFELIKQLNPIRIILKSWNYYIVKGYKLTKGYLCYSGGYRKPTILLIMDKINLR